VGQVIEEGKNALPGFDIIIYCLGFILKMWSVKREHKHIADGNAT